MDFYFNVKFDTWEEYSTFCAHAEGYFSKQKPATTATPQKAEKKSGKRGRLKAMPKSPKTAAQEVRTYTPKHW